MKKIFKRSGKLKIGSIAASCLLEIAYSTDLFLENIHQPYLAFRFGLEDAIEIRELRKEASQRRAMRRLEQKRLIKLKKIGNIYKATLTDEGMAEALRLQVKNSSPLPDGTLCMVVFDVPMDHHRIRKSLRGFLKWAGFTKVQQSVWASTKDAGETLAQLFRLEPYGKWIRIFRAQEQSNH